MALRLSVSGDPTVMFGGAQLYTHRAQEAIFCFAGCVWSFVLHTRLHEQILHTYWRALLVGALFF